MAIAGVPVEERELLLRARGTDVRVAGGVRCEPARRKPKDTASSMPGMALIDCLAHAIHLDGTQKADGFNAGIMLRERKQNRFLPCRKSIPYHAKN